jgi:hypothetical protein
MLKLFDNGIANTSISADADNATSTAHYAVQAMYTYLVIEYHVNKIA